MYGVGSLYGPEISRVQAIGVRNTDRCQVTNELVFECEVLPRQDCGIGGVSKDATPLSNSNPLKVFWRRRKSRLVECVTLPPSTNIHNMIASPMQANMSAVVKFHRGANSEVAK